MILHANAALSRRQRERLVSLVASALKVADVFKIDPGRLARADFGDLLAHELADAERYRHVENHIRNVKRKLERKDHGVLPPKRARQKGAR